MNIVVCVKSVPLVEGVDLKVSGTDIAKETLKFAINEWDEYALEEAVLLKEKLGGEVTVLTLTTPKQSKNIEQTLRECYAKGADNAIQLVDEIVDNLDPFAKSKILSKVIKGLSFDLVFTGVQASDDGCAQIGPTVATLLGLPYVTLVTKLEILAGGKAAKVERELEEGFKQVVELPLPALLTIQTGINVPRYAPFAKIRAAMKKEIKTLSLKDIGLDPAEVMGWKRASVAKMAIPVVERKTVIIRGSPEEEAAGLVSILREKGFGG
ncbi:MAG: electron transfer flavoprotein subunit beta/FixA family protein [Candidatus Bathyarchaeia archaeon]